MDPDVTCSAIVVLRVLIMLRPLWLLSADFMSLTVAGQAKLIHGGVPQQSRISRAVRRVTRSATFGLHRRMFERERTLLVDVTLDARGIGAGRQPGLLQLEPTMRVMAIAAAHCAFQHFVMEGH